MKSRDFAYWLQGYLEIAKQAGGETGPLSASQVVCIEKHLALVFVHEIDPSMGDDKHNAHLNKIHGGGFGPDKPVMRC